MRFSTSLIIAGGGGGAFYDKNGGNGGGLEGSSNPGTERRACYGTQTGCGGIVVKSNEKEGTLGTGACCGGGAGGGGYYGGGNSNNGGGGGSGYIGGVISYSIFKKVTEQSDHRGNGTARISIIGTTDFVFSKNCRKYITFIGSPLIMLLVIKS